MCASITTDSPRRSVGLRLSRLAASMLFLVLLSLPLQSASPAGKVIVYTSQDQVYAEPILQQFQQQTGLQPAIVFDSEAVKTVGLANRLIAERKHPQCDLFWSNEELRTRQLAAQGIWRPSNGWATAGYRSRRLIINTNHLTLASAPSSLTELTNVAWRGKVVLAYPLFGTTATHFLALRAAWGNERWEAWCRALARNKPLLVDGNSVAAKMVAQGEAWIGMTDSDDAAAEQREGAPLAVLPINAETLLIPNTFAITRGASHETAAERLLNYLRQPHVIEKLVAAQALEGVDPTTVTSPTLQPNWALILRDLGPATETLKQIFLR